MLKLILLSVITLATVHASGDFVVLHSPDSVAFIGNETIEQSLLTEVYAACLGFTVKQKGTWNGMYIKDVFALPEAVVAIVVEGIESLDASNGIRFPLDVNEAEETTWQALSGRLAERDNDNTLVRISLGDGLDALGQSALGELKPTPIDGSSLKALSLDNEEDRKFLDEVQLLNEMAKKIPSTIKADNKPDVYWLVMSGLPPVIELHGKDSTASKEALFLLNEGVNVISQAFVNAYDGQVVIGFFTNDASQVRRTRSVIYQRQRRDADNKNKNVESTAEAKRVSTNRELNNNRVMNKQDDRQEQTKGEEETNTVISNDSEIYNDTSSSAENSESVDGSGTTENPDKDLNEKEHKIKTNTKKIGQGDRNLSKKYTDNYPIIFNIILWFGVIFFFSLLAICITIAEMDPGRDSIIYRMTSNRMKKDN